MNQDDKLEFDENFAAECEQAILDRDDKIKSLLSELSNQKKLKDDNKKFDMIENSLHGTRKSISSLKIWLKNFNENKLKKWKSLNKSLKIENETLKSLSRNSIENKRNIDEKIHLFIANLKSEIMVLRSEIQEIKTKQKSNINDFKFLINENKQKMDSSKYMSTLDSENNKSFLTPVKNNSASWNERSMEHAILLEENSSKNGGPVRKIQTNNIKIKQGSNESKRDSKHQCSKECIMSFIDKKTLLQKLQCFMKNKEKRIFIENNENLKRKKSIENSENYENLRKTVEKNYDEKESPRYFFIQKNLIIPRKNGESNGSDKLMIGGIKMKGIDILYNKCLLHKNDCSL